MKKFLVLLSILVFVSVFGFGNALAANPDKIKVGILLPLTGTFAAVAETQKEGALLAVDVVNKKGGLNMPWGKVTVEGVVADDEAKQDVGVRRYRYMVSEGVKGVGGQTWAPLAYAINAIVSKEPMPYFPVCVMAKDASRRASWPDSTFAAAYSPWTVGYMAGSAAIKTLGKKKIFFLARADSWGWDIRDGVYAAAKENGAEIVGYDEVSLGTSDFTTDSPEGQGGQARCLHLRPVCRRRRRAAQAVPPDGPQQGDDHLQLLHHQRGRQRPPARGARRASTRCIISTTT